MVPPTRVNYDYKFKLQSSIYKSIDLDNKIQIIHPPPGSIFPSTSGAASLPSELLEGDGDHFLKYMICFQILKTEQKCFFIFNP